MERKGQTLTTNGNMVTWLRRVTDGKVMNEFLTGLISISFQSSPLLWCLPCTLQHIYHTGICFNITVQVACVVQPPTKHHLLCGIRLSKRTHAGALVPTSPTKVKWALCSIPDKSLKPEQQTLFYLSNKKRPSLQLFLLSLSLIYSYRRRLCPPLKTSFFPLTTCGAGLNGKMDTL